MSKDYPYVYEMASVHDAPEAVPQAAAPEVYHAPDQHHQYGQQPYYNNTTSPVYTKPEDSSTMQHSAYTPTAGAASLYTGAHDGQTTTEHGTRRNRGKICGCTFIVFVLSVVIAMLAAAVIGLAAGTGAEASRANRAENKLAALNGSGPATATVTVTAPTPTASGFNAIDNNCSMPNSPNNGKTYTTQFFNNVTFTQFCNKDAPGGPLMSLFTADFNTCMDACAAYTASIPGDFKSQANSTNAKCAAISFIPLWTTKAGALAGGAPGNCYLKPGPTNQTSLNNPNIGTECHAAILTAD